MNGEDLSPEEKALRARQAQKRLLMQLLHKGSPAVQRTLGRTQYPGETRSNRLGAATVGLANALRAPGKAATDPRLLELLRTPGRVGVELLRGK